MGNIDVLHNYFDSYSQRFVVVRVCVPQDVATVSTPVVPSKAVLSKEPPRFPMHGKPHILTHTDNPLTDIS